MLKEFYIFEGDSYDDALNKALQELSLTKDEVAVEVLKEKKSFMFRRGSTKLKIIPTVKKVKEEPAEAFLEEIEPILVDNIELDPNIHQEKEDFILTYREDGLYLSVIKDPKVKDQDLTQNILEYLKDKQVKDYDLVQATLAVHEKGREYRIAPNQQEVLVDSTLKTQFSKDKMEVSIYITKALGGNHFTLETLKQELIDNNINYGVDEEQLSRLVKLKHTDHYVPIAKGRAPIDGIDGKVIYHFNPSKEHKPVVLEDGSVDFKHLDIIKNVKQGDLLVEVLPPSDGVPGINVMGVEVPAKKGKEGKFKKGKNTTESDDGLKLYAAIDGQVRIDDGKVTVSEVYQIQGNVDNSTGNINFNGTVIVNGNVRSGFKISAEGNIEVNGVVEGATLISKGNIILNRGIQGNNAAYLECEGNLVAKYIENSKIKCDGDITADFILHSDVVAKGKIILAGKKSLVVGGEIRASEEIRARVVGSHMGTLTKLEVGVDPEIRNKYEELKGEALELQKNCENLKKTIDLLNRQAKITPLPQSKEEILIKSIKTYEYLKKKYDLLHEELQLMEERIQNLSMGKVHVEDRIYPGVKVIISNALRYFYDESTCCTLSKKDGEIYIGPFEK
ncbi:FapA family protein [Alkaliphilus transvaalensis]|uniref:FapA family protein n=1 Tax=Alkaliphilus transvaalensis TaxID=114628 RepID=UPI000687B774|nr:FapA family protein [Alkaliphilus transvaalensis]